MKAGIKPFINSLVGKKLEYLGCAAEILDFGFSDNLVLHGMGLTRIICDGDILITTIDYQSWDEKTSENNDEYYNIVKFRDRIIGGTVVSASINKLHDLTVKMDNGVMIECIIANSYPHYEDEENEQWVLFEHTADHSGKFLTVYNKMVRFD